MVYYYYFEPDLNDPIPDCFGNDELRILSGVECKFIGHILEWDLGVAEGDCAQSRLNNVVSEADNEHQRVVILELLAVGVQGLLEPLQVP